MIDIHDFHNYLKIPLNKSYSWKVRLNTMKAGDIFGKNYPYNYVIKYLEVIHSPNINDWGSIEVMFYPSCYLHYLWTVEAEGIIDLGFSGKDYTDSYGAVLSYLKDGMPKDPYRKLMKLISKDVSREGYGKPSISW